MHNLQELFFWNLCFYICLIVHKLDHEFGSSGLNCESICRENRFDKFESITHELR